jgi:hypothetical protein
VKKHKSPGQLQNVILLFVIIFAVGITVVLGNYILTTVYDGLRDEGITTATSNEVMTQMEANFEVFDYALVLMAIIMIIGLMITSFLIPTHPIFLVINIIGIFILIFLGMIMTNVYGEIVAGEGVEYLGDSADVYTMYNFLMNNIAFIGAIVVFITSVIVYSRSR